MAKLVEETIVRYQIAVWTSRELRIHDVTNVMLRAGRKCFSRLESPSLHARPATLQKRGGFAHL